MTPFDLQPHPGRHFERSRFSGEAKDLARRPACVRDSSVPTIPLQPDSSTSPPITMVTRHRLPRARCGQFTRDSRRPYSHGPGLSQRGLRCGRARGRRRRLRPRPSQILDLRRLQQMPAASVVGRAQHRAPRARRRGEERYFETGRAAPRAVASHPAGNLPRARPALAIRKKRPRAPATSRSYAAPSIATFPALPSPV
jgi:hypothetical protein